MNIFRRRLFCGRILALAFLAHVAALPDAASAAILYESGTLGLTGIPIGDVGGTVPGTNVNPAVFVGVRFELTQSAITTQIGGHFVSGANNSFFGAIVALDDENDFPNSGNLSTPDVLGSTVLTFPAPSDEVFGELSLSLDPGWYVLVFGSGLFGTTGSGAAVRNGVDIQSPQYIAFQPGSVFGWVNLTTFPNHRFVLEGRVVPEPSVISLATAAWITVSLSRRFSRQFHLGD